jgi:sec-independent protein translocase protein TatB
MFDIGLSELLVISLVTLVVMGPERLPETVRTISLWIGRFKQAFNNARRELEAEVGMDDVRQQLHNEKVLRDLEKSKADLEASLDLVGSVEKQVSESLEASGTISENGKNA